MSARSGKRGNPKTRIGMVLKAKMQKTIIVGVSTLVKHPVYKKYVKTTHKYYAHDEKNIAKEGNKVKIIATRPLSKLKRWRLLEVLAQ